jgi:hypothetical protein
MINQDPLLIICGLMALVLGGMLWMYFSNGEPQEQTVLVSPFSGGASAPSTEQVYQVQVKDWCKEGLKFYPLLTGTGDQCQALKKDLLKRGYSVSDVRVVQLVQ